MSHDEPYNPAEALGQALTRAEAAEAECRGLRIELEDAGNQCSRLAAQLREQQDVSRNLAAQVFELKDVLEARDK